MHDHPKKMRKMLRLELEERRGERVGGWKRIEKERILFRFENKNHTKSVPSYCCISIIYRRWFPKSASQQTSFVWVNSQFMMEKKKNSTTRAVLGFVSTKEGLRILEMRAHWARILKMRAHWARIPGMRPHWARILALHTAKTHFEKKKTKVSGRSRTQYRNIAAEHQNKDFGIVEQQNKENK